MKKRHAVFYRLLRPLVIAFLSITFGYRYKKAKNLPDNYIVLSNHATDFDPLFVASSFPKNMYFVASEHIARWPFAYKLLKFAFKPILRYKGASGASAVLDILRHLKSGANVALFAEGVRTWDGVTCPILPSTGKLIKSAGCGLVTYKITGGYFASPMWAGSKIRRGSICGAPVNIYTKEQLKAMSASEIYKAIVSDLYEDAYERQLKEPKKYSGKNLAEGLENLLFICPECGAIDTFSSHRDTATCGKCGFSIKYDKYGMLSEGPFKTLKEFSDWQKEKLLSMAESGTELTCGSATVSTVKAHEEAPITSGELTVSREFLKCGEITVPLENISEIAMHGQRAIVFTAGTDYYELIPQDGVNALKFYLYCITCKNITKENVS